jgi:ribulose-phosphate 3-epimerase
MTEVIPAILTDNFNELREKISRVVNVSTVVQIDMCDGIFVPTITWPFNELKEGHKENNIDAILEEEEGLPFWDSLDFEFDLMVKDAHKQFEFFTRLGAKRIVFHLEAEDEKDFKEFLEALDIYVKENIEIGLALNTTTDIDKLKPFINLVDFIQCMGIANIGFQGEEFDERVLNQIKELRSQYKELIISVDGSVNEITAPLLVKAGANRLVIGSAIMNSYDVRETIKEFENLGV